MKMIHQVRSLFDDYLMRNHNHQATITIFCKSLYIFLLLKIFFMKSILPERLQNLTGLGNTMSYVVIGLFVGIVFIGVFLKLNYFTAFLIFISSFIVSKATRVIANGSDLVLNLFLFLSIFLTSRPGIKRLREEQRIVQNFAFLICLLQVVVIYLISGLDKLTSQAWRSGDAIFSIINLDFFFSPLISISLSETECLLIAWIVILFELSFAFLVWFKKIRYVLLAFGILFHLGIAVLLSLPDFGILMILLYCLFIQFPKRITGKPMPAVYDDN